LFHALFEVDPESQAALERVADSLPKFIEGDNWPPVPEQEIRQWCDRWNLTAPWCADGARQFIWMFWRQARPDGERFSSEALRSSSSAAETATQPFRHRYFKIDFGFWAITRQTRKEFEEQCHSVFKWALETFCDGIEQQAQFADMERTREKREFDHFYWLARRLVHGESAHFMKDFSASLDGVSIRAINKAVNALARDLELTVTRPRETIVRQRAVGSFARAMKRRKRTG